MDTDQQDVRNEREWDFLISQLTENIDGFGIIKTVDKFGCDRYYWKCRDDRGVRKTSNNLYDTPKECMIDFFHKIEGFWFG